MLHKDFHLNPLEIGLDFPGSSYHLEPMTTLHIAKKYQTLN